MTKVSLILVLIIAMCGCTGGQRSITEEMWSNSNSVTSVMIAEGDLSPEGKNKLDGDLGKGVVYDQSRKAYIIKVSNDQNWDKVSLKVLATPFTVLADGVKYTVVVAVMNPELTMSILKVVLNN